MPQLAKTGSVVKWLLQMTALPTSPPPSVDNTDAINLINPIRLVSEAG